MKRICFLLLMYYPLFAHSQTDSIAVGAYNWKEPVKTSRYSAASVLFEGSTHDMDWVQASSNTLYFSRIKADMHLSGNEELLLLIRSGGLRLGIADSLYQLGAGSIALLHPGQVYSLQSLKEPCSYYTIYFRNNKPSETGKNASSPIIINWDTVVFKPGEKGGRRNFLECSTATFKRLEIHATTLKQGLASHAPHTHKAAEFTLIKEGKTEMLIGDKHYTGEAGAVYYAASNVLHALENKGTGDCTYFAIQFE